MGLTGETEEALCTAFTEMLAQLNKDLKIPNPKAYGIDEMYYMSVLDNMTKDAIKSGSPDNNPKVFTAGEIKEMYKEAYAK